MLQNQVEFLRENINTGGIQLSSISISLQNNDQKNHKANREKRKENNITKNEVSENKGKETNIKSLGYNTYEFLA
jgi:flagellar hook-length control protein FliK